MSDAIEEGLNIAIDPITNLDKGTSPEAVRAVAAAWAKSGVDLNTIATSLAERGVAPINFQSAEFANARADVLMRDPEVRKHIADGTVEGMQYVAEISAYRLAAQRFGDTSLMDRPRTAEDYLAPVHSALAASGVHDFDPKYVAGLQSVATALQLQPEVLSGIVQTAADAGRETSRMSPEQHEVWSQQQVASLESLFSAETLDAANKELSKHEAGFDLRKAARQGGALAAATLIHFLQAKNFH